MPDKTTMNLLKNGHVYSFVDKDRNVPKTMINDGRISQENPLLNDCSMDEGKRQSLNFANRQFN